ncbi:LOW QUALITY PROTEIN: hypothetical protein ACHAW6_004918 [Cyclotella cf. meneghiniana]
MVLLGTPPTAPSEFELSRDRVKRGLCPTCGLQTCEIVNQGFFRGTKFVPLTNEYVVGGRCLLCNPVDSVGIVSSVTALPAVPIFPSVQVMDNLCNHSSKPIEEDADSEVRLSTKTFLQNEQINDQTNIPVPDFPPDQNVSSSGVEQSEKKSLFAITKNPPLLDLLIVVIVVVVVVVTVVVVAPALTREQLVTNEIESNVLQRNVKFKELSWKDSQNLALDGLLQSDQLRQNIRVPNLNQRYILALLAFEFGTIFISSSDWLSDADECNWDGVTCLVNGDVNELLLSKS